MGLVGGLTKDPPMRIYAFYEDRKHVNIVDLLKDYKGVLHSDKYGGYEKLANKKQFIWDPCWSHIRRNFFEAQAGDSVFREWVLEKIKALFDLEEKAWELLPEERVKKRRDEAVPIIDELIVAIQEKLIHGKLLPKCKLRQALGYFVSLIPHLKNYIDHPYAHLDNNIAERAIRPLAIGRKNWLFVGNEDGGEAAAIAYSLIQTCRALKINPQAYLHDVMIRLLDYPANKLEELLPDKWAMSRTIG